MNSAQRLDRPTRHKLAQLAARTVLAAALGMAVMGLTAAMANADPAPPGPPTTQNPHSESGLCNQTSGRPPPPGYCGPG
jgi:hypothetical protein